MSHRHVVVCDQCGKESQFETFGVWVRISIGGDLTPSKSADLCNNDCLAGWLQDESDRLTGDLK